MQHLENEDMFLNFDYTKTAKMPEGPFCQIRAHIFDYFSGPSISKGKSSIV